VSDDTNFKKMDDGELDDMLDDLMVQIVESFVEVGASRFEIQEELNVPDKSGFALLHYVSLPSLCFPFFFNHVNLFYEMN
jgi:hypothetical protein